MRKQAINLESVIELTRQREDYPLAKSFVVTANQLLGADVVMLIRLERRGDDPFLTSIAIDGSTQLTKKAKEKLEKTFKSLIVQCAEQKKTIVDASKEHTDMALPAHLDGSVSYILCTRSDSLSEGDQATLEAVAKVFENYLHIISESEHDHLTGLLNRKVFIDKTNNIIKHCQPDLLEMDSVENEPFERRQTQSDQGYWMSILDIDHYENVVDNSEGVNVDEVLASISTLMRNCFRAGDLLFYCGCKEFVVVIGPTSKETSISAFNRFRETVAANDFSGLDKVTVSIGIVNIGAKDNPGVIVGQADQALNHAKKNGGNQIRIHEDVVPEGIAESSSDETESSTDE